MEENYHPKPICCNYSHTEHATNFQGCNHLKRAKKLLRQRWQAQNATSNNENGLAFASQRIPNNTAQQTHAATYQSQPQQSAISNWFSWGDQRSIDCSGNLANPQFPSLQSCQLQLKLRTLSNTAKATNKADPKKSYYFSSNHPCLIWPIFCWPWQADSFQTARHLRLWSLLMSWWDMLSPTTIGRRTRLPFIRALRFVF
jgi:hypothetical protein